MDRSGMLNTRVTHTAHPGGSVLLEAGGGGSQGLRAHPVPSQGGHRQKHPKHNAITSIALPPEISPPLPSAGMGEASGTSHLPGVAGPFHSFPAFNLEGRERPSGQPGRVISVTLGSSIRKKSNFLLLCPHGHHVAKCSLWRHPK